MTIWRPGLKSYYDYTGIARELERLARRGWRLREMNAFGWKLERCDPAPLRYTVTYFPQSNELDPNDGDTLGEYLELCRGAGWELAARWRQMLVLCARVPDPVPVETDPTVQVSTIHRTMCRNSLPWWGLMILLGLEETVGKWLGFTYGDIYRLAHGPTVLLMSFWLLTAVGNAAALVSYFLWYFRAKAAAARGEFVPGHSTRVAVGALWAVGIVTTAVMCMQDSTLLWYLLLVAAVTAILGGILHLVKEKNRRDGMDALSSGLVLSGVGIIAAYALVLALGLPMGTVMPDEQAAATDVEWNDRIYVQYQAALPLTLQDLQADMGQVPYSREADLWASPLVQVGDYSHIPVRDAHHISAGSGAELSYTIIESPWQWLLEKTAAARLEMLRYYGVLTEIDPTPWSAEKAWGLTATNGGYQYLLLWDGGMADIYTSFPMTETQAQTVGACMTKEGTA